MLEYAYVLMTPYSIHKSRTGGIIGRILSSTDLDLRAARMYAPSDAMIDELIEAVDRDRLSAHNKRLFRDYANVNLRPNSPRGISNRCMLLVFEGEDASGVIRRTIGHVTYKPKGDTVRGTFGDYITHDGEVVYFEPAVLCASDSEAVREHLNIFKRYADSDGGVISHALDRLLDNRESLETTLVLLKPDTVRPGSSRTGNIIDMFSKTALFIVGAKLVHFSVAQAEKFYAPQKSIFETKLEPILKRKIEHLLCSELPFHVDSDDLCAIAKILRKKNALCEFNQIIHYITGLDPLSVAPENRHKPGMERCLALLYYGSSAISKIRDRLGATDPLAAKGGTVRSVFGQNILKNGAHASDSPESSLREREIVGLLGSEQSDLDEIPS